MFIWIIIIFLLCIAFGEIYLAQKKNGYEKDLVIGKLTQEIDNCFGKNKMIKSNDFSVLNGNLRIINIDGDTLNLSDVIFSKTLVFRYSVMNCGACVNQEIENIRRLSTEHKIDGRIIFIAYYKYLRNEIIAYRSMDLGIPIYIVPNNNLCLEIERYNIPYYFTINLDFIISNTFIPERINPNLTDQYLETMFEKVLFN